LAYTIAYPAWPMVSGATAGVLGWSTRANVAEDIVEHEAQNAALVQELVGAELASVEPGSDLHRYATARGGAVFRAQCSQCHGSGAAGAMGYPNLLDNDWLWGGTIDDIAYTVAHGIRNETSDARYSEMPAFGEVLSSGEIAALVAHVQALPQGAGGEGETLFLDNCAACHGEQGEGMRDLGAPNLGDAIWLYGGDDATLTETIAKARFGVMPAWGQRLSEADVRAVSLYVHSLGGGE
jgi:cytochrome c oxidase cbb3-type subunit 3